MPFNIATPDWREMGIDPGTNTLGYAILDLDRKNNRVIVQHASTIVAEVAYDRYHSCVETQGTLITRLQYLESVLYKTMLAWKINGVILEKPFIGKNPSTYESLLNSTRTIERALANYNPNIAIDATSPRKAKMAVGSDPKSKDKLLVQKGVMATEELYFINPDLPRFLDEHAFDAIAVGFSKLQKQLKGGL